MNVLTPYLIGVGLIWAICALTALREPTAHGRDILIPVGFIVGLVWPVVPLYVAVVVFPYVLVSKWRGDL